MQQVNQSKTIDMSTYIQCKLCQIHEHVLSFIVPLDALPAANQGDH